MGGLFGDPQRASTPEADARTVVEHAQQNATEMRAWLSSLTSNWPSSPMVN